LDDAPSFVNEGTVNAPLWAVWNIWTTGEGYRALGGTPKSFPFKEAWKNTWTVITLTDLGNRTHLRIASMGYGADEESKAMRRFFGEGNASTIKDLQDYFNAEAGRDKRK
jgi:hypothetical protein